MIVCGGIVGACLLVGGARYHEQGFQVQGAGAALAVLTALTVLALVLPNYAARELGPLYSTPQLVFAGLVSLVLYGSFVFVQTARHRDYFLPVETADQEAHAPPSSRMAALSAGLLIVCLVAIVGLAKTLTPTVELGVARLGVPKAVVGIVIAALVLLPEGLAALRAAQANQLQTSLNLALGSALATIGLTILAVAAVSIVTAQPLELGLDIKDQVLLALTLLVSAITLGHWQDHGPSRHRASGHLRRIFVLCAGAVSVGPSAGDKERMSASGTSRHFTALRNLVAIGHSGLWQAVRPADLGFTA